MQIILVLNCGSSSIKFSLFSTLNLIEQMTGLIENIASERCDLQYKIHDQKFQIALANANYETALLQISALIKTHFANQIVAIGHRVVHGGEYFSKPTLIDANVIEKIAACIELAPLHNPANLEAIKIFTQLLPNIPQIAVFDTAFHQSLTEKAYLYALPYEFYQKNKIRRYGFHGTSHQYITEKTAEILKIEPNKINLISAHLGNGCSLCAIKHGKSIDTSMGMTPLEGLVMGTRCGDLDPGIFAFLTQTLQLDASKIDQILNKKSGLLGISQLSNDMRELFHQGDSLSKLAIEIFCYRLAKYIASYFILFEKLDALVFTAGIGENSPTIRETVIAQLKALNYSLDQKKNLTHGKGSHGIISNQDSPLVLVIATREEYQIAKSSLGLIGETSWRKPSY